MERSRAELDYLNFVDEWQSPLPYILSRTSGSTGTPKEIRLLKSDMWRSAQTAVEQFGLTAGSTIASALPVTSIATKMAIVRHLAAGCRYVPLPASNVFDIPCHIDLLSIGPSQTELFLQNPGLRHHVDTLFVGGAPLSQERMETLLSLGYNVCVSYGMTETCSNVALCRSSDGIFEANPGISFEADPRGCLVIVAPDYSFSGTVTNDVVDLLDERHFRWVGRYDNVINSGGLKLYPEKIEPLLADVIGRPFYIVGRPHPLWGEALAAVVEGYEGDAAAIVAALRGFSDGVHRPKSVAVVAEFERTPTGKIKRILPQDAIFHEV